MKYPAFIQVAWLVKAYNSATNPTILRTDREHNSNRRIARVAKKMLQRDFFERLDYVEHEGSGMLVNKRR